MPNNSGKYVNKYNKKSDNRSNKMIMHSNLLTAVVKNKREGNSLNRFCHKLDKECEESCYRIARESYQCTLTLSELKLDMKSNCLVDANQHSYFNLMRRQKFNPNNYFVPYLMKNLEDQETASMRSFNDMKSYRLGSAKSKKCSESTKDDDDNFDYQYTNSVNFFSESDFAMPNQQQQPRESSRKAFITDMPSASFLKNTKESAYYTVPENKVATIKPRAMTASYPKKKALLKDRVMSGKFVQSSSDKLKYDSMSVNSFKTVRREQKSAKEANHTRDMKIHLLRHIHKTNFQSYDSSTSSSRRWIF